MVHVSPAFLMLVASCCCLPSVVWCSSNHVGSDELGPLTPSSSPSSSSFFEIVPRGGAFPDHTSWTFDLPCTQMPWTPMASTSLNVVTTMENANDIDSSEYDLIIVGVTAPPKKSKSEDTNGAESKKKKKKFKNTEENSSKPSLIQLDPHSIADYINMNHNGIIDQILEDEGSSFKVKHNSMTSTVRISIPAGSDDSTNPNAKKLLKFVLLGFDTTTLDQNDDTTTNHESNNNTIDDDIKAKGRKIGSTLASLIEKELLKNKKSKKGGGKVLVVMPFSTRTEQVRHRSGDIDGASPSSLFLEEMASSFYTYLYKDQRFKGTAGIDDNDDDSSASTSVHLVWDSCNPPSQDESLVVSQSVDNQDHGNTINGSEDEEPAQYQLSDDEIKQALDRGRQMALGVYMAKDIVNSPHNTLNSVSLADTAQKICSENSGEGTLSCQILDMKDCEKRGMGSYLAVARGSETVPKFIHITYRPKRNTYRRRSDLRKLGIVGKGLLFDTGGYNIKTAMMELMKFDCGGAAAVLGAARAIGALSPKDVEVHFVVAACENMINERAVVPGDVITASNGKTIEVINTDAEGRLTMADALVYIDKEIGCEEIIELSTLTGACMVSLGSAMAGLWTDYDELAAKVQSAASSTGDKVWRMPMAKEYKDQIKSKIADLRNLGTVRYGGAIHAALFLQEFVSKDKPFAHIDMAGPVWSNKIGATGYGAKLVTEWVCSEGRK